MGCRPDAHSEYAMVSIKASSMGGEWPIPISDYSNSIYVSELKRVCENGMKNAARLAKALANLTVGDIWLDGSRETFDGNSNLSGYIAKVRRRTVFTMMPAFKPYAGIV
jgi:hypothetical protein